MVNLREDVSIPGSLWACPAPRLALLAVTLVMSTALSACGEKSQELGKNGPGTTVSRDTRAYDGEASKFALTSFKRGDKTAWETHMRNRMQAQDEYSREK